MNKKNLIVIVACLSLISCSIRKSQGVIIDTDGKNFYQDSLNNIRLTFLGDYWFHEFDKKHFLNASTAFLNYTTSQINGRKPELLFASHTQVSPLHSVIGIIYKGAFQDSTYLTDLKTMLKDELKVKNPKQSYLYTILGDVIKWEYPVWNPDTKIYSTHNEFILRRNENLIRLVFWTIESNTDVFNFESENIMKTIKSF